MAGATTKAKDAAKATQFATNPLGPLPKGVTATDAAAWTVVANVRTPGGVHWARVNVVLVRTNRAGKFGCSLVKNLP